MSYTLIVSPAAHGDIASARAWYEARRDGLGQRFVTAVLAKLRDIENRPESFRLVRRGIRRALVKPYSYAIVYHLVESRIEVATVVHTARRRKVWLKRFKRR